MLVYFIAGLLLWPLLEYGLHRGLGHHFLRGRTAFSREHLQHHAQKDFFAPTWKKAALAAPVFLALLGLFTRLAGFHNALALSSGFFLMYSTYEVVHRRAHTRGPTGPYSRWVRRNHFSHHFQNPRKNHGVTTPVLDYLFGTHVEPGRITVPERFAMAWLCDPDSGEVWPHLARDYVLKPANTRAQSEQTGSREDVEAAHANEAPRQ
jgi:sterol desaturase/sphingolipid hydroxylase (fatty acid hydroxylase superfamily)